MQQNKKLISDGYDLIAKKSLESKAMRDLDELISQVSSFDTLVLIRGESGSGKEVVAVVFMKHLHGQEKPLSRLTVVLFQPTC